MFIVSTIIGSVLAVSLAYSIDLANPLYLNQDAPVLLAFLSISTVALLYFLRLKESHFSEEINSKVVLGASIAHEMKNIITSMKMFVMTISSELEQLRSDNVSLDSLINDLKTSLSKSDNTINTILFSVRKDIRLAADNDYYPASDIIAQALDNLCLSKVDFERIKLDLSDEYKFFGSKYLLSLVISNIIGNSLKHAGENVVINITDKNGKISINDNGIGIDNKDIRKVFIPFEKDGDINSTGLGIAFCITIMESMGGSIDLESRSAEYTNFTINMADAIKEDM